MHQSLEALAAILVPMRHPFKGQLAAPRIGEWQRAIQAVSDEAIEAAIVLGFSVCGVHVPSQSQVAQLMKARRDALPSLLAAAQK